MLIPDRKINIIVVDDNKNFREALMFLVRKNESWQLIGEAENGSQLMNLSTLNDANVILLDLEMPVMDGLTAAKLLSWHYPKIKTIAVTMYNDKAYLYELISKGFKGYISKSKIYDELENAIHSVMENKYYFPEELLRKI